MRRRIINIPPKDPPKPKTIDYIPHGNYDVIIGSIEEKNSRSKPGVKYWQFELHVDHPDVPDDFRLYWILFTEDLHHEVEPETWYYIMSKWGDLIEAITGTRPEGAYTLNAESFLGKKFTVKVSEVEAPVGNPYETGTSRAIRNRIDRVILNKEANE